MLRQPTIGQKQALSKALRQAFRPLKGRIGGPCKLSVSWKLSSSATHYVKQRHKANIEALITIAPKVIWQDWYDEALRSYWIKRVRYKFKNVKELAIFVLFHEVSHAMDFYDICEGDLAMLHVWLDKYETKAHDDSPIEKRTDQIAIELLKQYFDGKTLKVSNKFIS